MHKISLLSNVQKLPCIMMVLYHLYNGTAIVVLSVFVLETRQNEGQVQPITSRI